MWLIRSSFRTAVHKVKPEDAKPAVAKKDEPKAEESANTAEEAKKPEPAKDAAAKKEDKAKPPAKGLTSADQVFKPAKELQPLTYPEGTTDEHLMTNWRLKAKGQVVQESPRYEVIQDTINHWAHHRGQMTVYLRLMGAKVPAIYGPSADEVSFA